MITIEAACNSSSARTGKRYPVSRSHSQNVLHHLRDRESAWKRRHPGNFVPHQLKYEREILKSVAPNLSVHHVIDHGLGYIRKFTPDGRYLLSFSEDQRSLLIFEFHGVAKVAAMLEGVTAEVIRSRDDSADKQHIRRSICDKLFTLRRSILLMTDEWNISRSHLNREFSIFIENGRYVLLGAISKPPMELFIPVEYYNRYEDLNDDCDLLDYTLFMVDLERECVTDTYSLPRDCILLAHNHGVSVFGNTLAILSKCRQCIDILECREGKLKRLTTVNYDDGTEMSELYGGMEIEFSLKPMLSELKQKVLSMVYRQIAAIPGERARKQKIQEFYKHFEIYESMTITKMQLIAHDKLLLRYEQTISDAASDISNATNDEKNKFRLYVFYCLKERQAIKVCEKNSVELLYLLRNFCDTFRNVRSLQTGRQSSSPSNNTYFRAAFDNTISSIPGGQIEAALRFNPTLPISCQSFTTTPYLDFSLFNYNDRLISALERPKISSMEVICFKDRNTNVTKFRIHMDIRQDGDTMCGSCRELVAFIFHPYEPFAISIQKLTPRHVVNFHVYNKSTIVRPCVY